jgi:hypothetical protein
VPEGIVDVAFEELLKFLLVDWELPVSRRKFPCVPGRRNMTQKIKKGPQSKNVDVEVDEAISPQVGMIVHVTRSGGGKVPEDGVVRFVGSSVRRNNFEFAAKNAVDLGDDSVFCSRWKPEQWLYYGLSDMVIITKYSILFNLGGRRDEPSELGASRWNDAEL